MYKFWYYHIWNRKKTINLLFELAWFNQYFKDRKWIKNEIYKRKNIIIWINNKIKLV